MIDFKKKWEEQAKDEKLEMADQEVEALLNGNKRRKRIITYTVAIIIIGLIFSGRVLMSSQNATSWLPGGIFLNKLKHLVPSTEKQLKGEENDRINILLLGMGGQGHDGAYLTDTIMVASLKPSTKQVALISIPRDLTAPVSNWRKINNVNALAEAKNPGSGGTATAQAISELLQIPIDYYVRADFNGFVRIIDEIGGIQVNVENTFNDYSYPIDGQEDNPNYYARYEHLHIEQGLQTMDGSLALKYARSRHALGTEGSDFARARRQQLVLEAVKDKLLSRQTLLNPVMIGKLVNEFSQNISTNLNVWEMLRFWNLFKDVNKEQIINKVLSDAPDGFLVSTKGDDGAYILVPRSGNFTDIVNMVQNIFNADQTNTNQAIPGKIENTKPAIKPLKESAKIVINNGTWITGLASKTAAELVNYQFQIIKTGNAAERNYEHTLVYDLSDGQKSEALKALETAIGATKALDSPAWLEEYKSSTSTQPDFIIILGTDASLAQ